MATKKSSKRAKRRELDFEDLTTELEKNHNKINFKLKQRAFKFTPKQKELIDIVNDPSIKVVLIEGPAGTSKSLMAVYCGLLFLQKEMSEKILYVRSAVESATKSIGFLPGDITDKMSFFEEIILDKLLEMVEIQYIAPLMDSKMIETMPLNYVRGCSWRNTFTIVDEVQNFTRDELLSTMTRIGENSKMILCGDRTQSDIKHSGLVSVFEGFDDEESRKNGIVTFEFTEEDIVRSEIVKFIVKKFKEIEA